MTLLKSTILAIAALLVSGTVALADSNDHKHMKSKCAKAAASFMDVYADSINMGSPYQVDNNWFIDGVGEGHDDRTYYFTCNFDSAGKKVVNVAATGSSDTESSSGGGSDEDTAAAEHACIKAVAAQVGVNSHQLSVIDAQWSQAGTNVQVYVPTAQKPWGCTYQAGSVVNVWYMGEG